MPPDVPEQLGRYEIVQRLSAGGMGEVFVARFAGPGGFLKPVALKRIHPHLSSDEAFINMLHDEANVTAAIKHPNVVQIIEVGSEGDSHYVVLDYVSGETLSKMRRELYKKDLRMPLWLAVWIGAEVAAALNAAHEARSLEGEQLEIIHRDVSLGNIMVADDGRPMLFDFGVAKAKQRMTHTIAGELKGKVSYMAPEIFHGASVNRTVDLYALGVVLYELLTGKSPFQRDSDLETIAAIQNGEVPPVVDLRPEVDWLLDAIVMRAMGHQREERYQTGAQLEQALREWARKNKQPHDATSAAKWLADTFPDKLQERRTLLASVASRQRAIPVTNTFAPTSGTNPTFGRSGGSHDEQSASQGALTPPPVVPSLSPAGLLTATPSELAAPPSRKWLGVAGAVGACVFGVVATLAATGSSPGTTSVPVASVSTPQSASAPTPVAPPVTASAPAPSASASVAAKPDDKNSGKGGSAGKPAGRNNATTSSTTTATATTPTSQPTTTSKKPGGPRGPSGDYP